MRPSEKIRLFWDDIFHSKLITTLERELEQVRVDKNTQLARMYAEAEKLRQDKDQVIADLRNDKSLLQAKVSLYEVSIQHRVGIDPSRTSPKKPNFAEFSAPPMKSRWQVFQEEYDAELKNAPDEIKAQEKATDALKEHDKKVQAAVSKE